MNESPIARVFTVLFTLVLFAVILYLAYITTKYIGKKYSVSTGMSGKNIKILDTVRMSQDKFLMIVKAGDKTVLIGVSKDHMEYICDVDESQLSLTENGTGSEVPQTPDFVQAFKTVLGDKMKNFKQKENNDENKK